MLDAWPRTAWRVLAWMSVGWGLACVPGTSELPEEQGPAPVVSAAALTGQTSFIDIRLRTGSGVSRGSTCGAANEVSPTCGGSSASDFNHYWIAPYNGVFTFSTAGAGTLFNTVLQVTDWVSGAPLGCNDDLANSTQSSVTVNLAQEQEVRITVDGRGSACGRFQLNISAVKSPCGPCNSPPDSCHERDGACVGSTCVYSLKPGGAACDDGNACTLNDSCGGGGTCQGTPLACDTPGACQEAPGRCVNGACQYSPSPSGSACDDGNVCSLYDSCDGQGRCLSNAFMDCGPAGYCMHSECEPTLGCVDRPCEACAAGYCI